MPLLSDVALTALILQCGAPVPLPTLTAIVMQESSGNPDAINKNRNGTRDFGLAQINEKNLPMLGETPETIMEPCRNIAAAARMLVTFSRYNTGSPTAGFRNGYAEAVWQRMR